MLVYTDSVDYARTVLGLSADLWSAPASELPEDLRSLIEGTYGARQIRQSELLGSPWQYLLLVEVAERSNYDILIELSRAGVCLPNRVLCLAGAGERFHGFKGRAWAAPKGNTYLAAYLRPAQPVELPATSFTVLAAVSVVDAIDAMPGLKRSAGIKWVNDILIDDAKVGGVLGFTQSVGGKITGAIVGIGVNVETEPDIEPTPFVPVASALKVKTAKPADCTQRGFFASLAAALDTNYRSLIEGGYGSLLERYRERSLIVGREITLYTDEPGPELDVLAQGCVTRIGDALELMIEGYEQPFTKGRPIINPPTDSCRGTG